MKESHKVFWLLAAISAIAVLSYIASNNRINTGQVIEKKHRSSGSDIEMAMDADGNMSPRLVDHPEEWIITITDHNNSALCQVTEDKWNVILVGDWFTCE